MDLGHCGLPTEELIPLAVGLLDAPADLIKTALDLKRSEGAVIANKVGETECVFFAGLYKAERTIATRLIALAGRRSQTRHEALVDPVGVDDYLI
jgi:exodeoxyribonuclease V alpha subunit